MVSEPSHEVSEPPTRAGALRSLAHMPTLTPLFHCHELPEPALDLDSGLPTSLRPDSHDHGDNTRGDQHVLRACPSPLRGGKHLKDNSLHWTEEETEARRTESVASATSQEP